VAFLGGSITAGSGWRELVCQELERRYPDTQFEFINAGIPSLGSTPGAFRLQRDVLAKGQVDLLFAEAAVNDDTNGFSEIEQLRGMEGIVRQALLSNPKMNVVLLHFVDPGKITEIRAGKTPVVIASHERVAAHYRLPSINLAKEVTERIDAGEFTWEDDLRDLHPSPFGHALYAKSIARLFAAAWETKTASPNHPTPSVELTNETATLPLPLDRFSYFHGQLVSPLALVEKHRADLGSDWTIGEKWQPTDQAGTRPGFVNVPALVAESPGATLRLQFEGVGVGVFVASGPDTGTLEFRVDEGDWQRCELFTQWSPGLHLPWAKMLAAELEPGSHQLELRVAETNDARSSGHAVRIIHLLVNGMPTKEL
jgi:lysophospholipase L1-like esterase